MKKKYLFLIAITIGITLFITSCSDTNKENTTTVETPKTKEEKVLPNTPIITQYTTLKLAVDSSWKALDQVEKDKIFAIKRLLQEISFNPKHKSNRLKEEMQKVDDLEAKKLKQEALADLSNMDNYDVLSDQVISSVIIFKEETPDMEGYPLADELIDDLDSLNGNAIISKRSDYGHVVLEYNKFIKVNYDELSKQGVENLKLMPGLFPEEEDSTSSNKSL